MLIRLHHIVVGFAFCTLFLLGCGGTDPAPVAAPTEANPEDHSGHDHGSESEAANAMASLSAEDRAAAEKQKICPVGGESLGTMGAPIKVSVNGRDVFICCEGCRESLLAEPDKFLAKLPQ